MLDVMYFLMEEDVTPVSKEQYTARDTLRTNIYPKFLGRPYLFSADSVGKFNSDHNGNGGAIRIDPPMDTEPVSGAPTPVPAGARTPVPVAAGSSNYAAPVAKLTRPPTQAVPKRQQVGDGVHKPYIPPTDGEIDNNPFRPFRGLRETPMF